MMSGKNIEKAQLLQDVVNHLRINQFYLASSDEDFRSINANTLPDDLSQVHRSVYRRIRLFIE